MKTHGAGVHGTWIYRPGSNAWFAGGTWVIVGVWLWSAATSAGADGLLRTLPWAALLALIAWRVFWHPRVEVDDDAVTLVNPWRTVRVPWAALIQVTTKYALTLVTPHTTVRAWAAPGPGRHAAGTSTAVELRSVTRGVRGAGDAVALGDLPHAPSGVVAHEVRRRWGVLVESGAIAQGEADTTPVTTAWSWVPLGLAAAALVAGVLSAAL